MIQYCANVKFEDMLFSKWLSMLISELNLGKSPLEYIFEGQVSPIIIVGYSYLSVSSRNPKHQVCGAKVTRSQTISLWK